MVAVGGLLFGLTRQAPALPTPQPPTSRAPGGQTPTSSGPRVGVNCANDTARDTTSLAAAIHATPSGGTVVIAAGTCALTAHLPISTAITITGAGATSTFLVQHASANIFQITAPGVTVENLNLDTATFNPGPGVLKNPKPGTLFSNSSHTTIRNVNSESGSGFGMRITGPNPCDAYPTQGTVVDNVNVTNTGHGGFTALDIDCTNGAVLTNITVHGDYIAFFKDENVTLHGENYTPDAKLCQAPWYITGPSSNITIDAVTSAGGRGISKGPSQNVALTNQTASAGC